MKPFRSLQIDASTRAHLPWHDSVEPRGKRKPEQSAWKTRDFRNRPPRLMGGGHRIDEGGHEGDYEGTLEGHAPAESDGERDGVPMNPIEAEILRQHW
jgi:hypothetical protein